MKKILFLLIAVSLTLQLVAQESVEAPEPQMQVINKAGETTDLSFGDEYTGEAPVTINLHANAE